MKEGYRTIIPFEHLRANSAEDLGSLAVILETESDENGRIFGVVEIIEGLYGGISVEVPGSTTREVNQKTAILHHILKTL